MISHPRSRFQISKLQQLQGSRTMSNTTTGPAAGTTPAGTKKETVYSGPGPQAKRATSSAGYGMPPGTTGAVYNGPASGGTVYNGPVNSGAVYNPGQQNGDARPIQAQPTAGAGSAAGSRIFFLIAGFSAANTVLILLHAPVVMAIGLAAIRVPSGGDLGPVLLLTAVAAGTFCLIGFFAAKGSKPAFLIGLLIYSGDTVLLLLSENAALHVVSIIFHGVFLFAIFKAFKQLES
jgi:hypothetical protein